VFDKILRRLTLLADGLEHVDAVLIAQKVVAGLFDGVSTRQLDELSAETAASMASVSPDWGCLASRLVISDMHKSTPSTFSACIARLSKHQPTPLVSGKLAQLVAEHRATLDASIRNEADFNYTYFGIRTLQRSYLLRCDDEIVERPQYMLMRVALGIHGSDLESVLETYELMSKGLFTHATPTLFNAGTPTPSMSSCFLLPIKHDSIEGIFDTLKECALISKSAGGIGVSVSNVRSRGAAIRGTNGRSNGLVPMLRCFNDAARYVDQGGGRRKGGVAVYLEPWHPDVFEFLDLRKNHGDDEMRTRDLFTGLWVCDLFMRRVKEGGQWTLMCPSECLGLSETWGAEFEALYCKFENEGRGRAVVRACDLWNAILTSQIETGTPYMMYKDTCNRLSNHRHLGVIRGSNLCSEMVEFSSGTETAACNLASVALPQFVSDSLGFDHDAFASVVRVVVRNLNRVIDGNAYATPSARWSNAQHRPLGIGVQGLADVFMVLGWPFDCAEARRLNADIFETLYFAALTESCKLAEEFGAHPSYAGSPVSRGILHHDAFPPRMSLSGRHDWPALRERIAAHGVRNSLLVAPMPTASTSQILGNNECFEPITSNLYSRRVLSGEFVVVNKHLVRALTKLGLWGKALKDRLVAAGGSVQGLDEVPQDVRAVFRTVWEIKQRSLIEMAADRAPFVDQSQSLNLFLPQPDRGKLGGMHMLGWSLGLKTGMYYFRTKPASEAIKFTLGVDAAKECTSCAA